MRNYRIFPFHINILVKIVLEFSALERLLIDFSRSTIFKSNFYIIENHIDFFYPIFLNILD